MHLLKTVRGGDDSAADGHPLSVHRTVPDSEVRVLDVQEVVRTVDRHLLLGEVILNWEKSGGLCLIRVAEPLGMSFLQSGTRSTLEEIFF